jgi:zinc transport system substrate-binding protein
VLAVLVCRTIPVAAAEPVRVAATICPLADVVRQVGGGSVEVATILPPGWSPHTFEPSPSQVAVLAHAHLAVKVGAGLDDWLDRLLGVGDRAPAVLVATDAAPAVDGDPHVWLDPVLVRDRIVPAVSAALAAADPAGAGGYAERAGRFTAALAALDREIAERTARFHRREFVATHGAWRYFARRYGLREIGVLEESPGKEPSGAAFAALVDAARVAGVTALFAEPQLAPRLAQVLAEELGVRVVVVDPLGGEKVPGRDSYVGLMRWNLRALAEALQ